MHLIFQFDSIANSNGKFNLTAHKQFIVELHFILFQKLSLFVKLHSLTCKKFTFFDV